MKSLETIKGIQIELSLVELYKDEVLYLQLLEKLTGLGFHLVGIEPGWYDDKTGKLIQFDGILFRE